MRTPFNNYLNSTMFIRGLQQHNFQLAECIQHSQKLQSSAAQIVQRSRQLRADTARPRQHSQKLRQDAASIRRNKFSSQADLNIDYFQPLPIPNSYLKDSSLALKQLPNEPSARLFELGLNQSELEQHSQDLERANLELVQRLQKLVEICEQPLNQIDLAEFLGEIKNLNA